MLLIRFVRCTGRMLIRFVEHIVSLAYDGMGTCDHVDEIAVACSHATFRNVRAYLLCEKIVRRFDLVEPARNT